MANIEELYDGLRDRIAAAYLDMQVELDEAALNPEAVPHELAAALHPSIGTFTQVNMLMLELQVFRARAGWDDQDERRIGQLVKMIEMALDGQPNSSEALDGSGTAPRKSLRDRASEAFLTQRPGRPEDASLKHKWRELKTRYLD